MEASGPNERTVRHQTEELRSYVAPRWFVAGRTELQAQGFTLPRIDNWVKSGQLVPLFQGVYSFGRDVEIRQAAWRGALLAAGPGAWLTGRSACEVHGLIECRGHLPAFIQVAIPAGRSRTLRGISPATRDTWVRVVRRDLSSEDVTVIDGLRLASAPGSLIDLAESARERELFFAFLEACRLGMFGRDEVDQAFRRVSRRRGAAKFKPLLAMWVPELIRIRSVFEGEYLLAWLADGWPAPKVNVKVFGREVDQYFPQQRFALELDGGAFHSDPMSVARDQEKVRYLAARGIEVRRVSVKAFRANPTGVVRSVARQAGFA